MASFYTILRALNVQTGCKGWFWFYTLGDKNRKALLNKVEMCNLNLEEGGKIFTTKQMKAIKKARCVLNNIHPPVTEDFEWKYPEWASVDFSKVKMPILPQLRKPDQYTEGDTLMVFCKSEGEEYTCTWIPGTVESVIVPGKKDSYMVAQSDYALLKIKLDVPLEVRGGAKVEIVVSYADNPAIMSLEEWYDMCSVSVPISRETWCNAVVGSTNTVRGYWRTRLEHMRARDEKYCESVPMRMDYVESRNMLFAQYMVPKKIYKQFITNC